MSVYYNEIDSYAAQWIRNLAAAGLVPSGDVDERSIRDVHPDDLHGYTQCHFFAGLGGWALAARLAGWPDDRELWTGSCPCQPFSVAGEGRGADDDRHLWPDQFRLVRARRPAAWMGEQVAAAVGKYWLDGVRTDLESIGYACRAAIVPACAVNAPHRRDRAWIVSGLGALGDGQREGLERHAGHDGAAGGRPQPDRPAAAPGGGGDEDRFGGGAAACHVADADRLVSGQRRPLNGGLDAGGYAPPRSGPRSHGSVWGNAAWIIGHDGKARRFEPGIRLLAHGVPARVGRLRAYGNAIVPQEAAEVIAAYMDCAPA